MRADTAEQLFMKGNALFGAGNREAAADCYRRALQVRPGFAAASFNLGCTLDLLGGPSQALPHFYKAATLRPEWCEAHGNLGLALARLGRMAEAAAELQAAAALKPADAGIRNNLGLALKALGKGAEAHASFQEAIRLDPLYAEAHNNLAILFESYGRTSEAIASCLTALGLRPEYPEAHNNLACALKSQGRHAEAIAHYREALRLKPEYHEAASSLLFTLCYPAGLSEEEIFKEHLAFGAALAAPQAHHDNDPVPDRVLRVGYVSADFREHAVARFIEPVLRQHDRNRFRIYCYSNVSAPDAHSARLEGLADHFVSIAGLSDEVASAVIRRDRIDLLIDLSGHTGGNRLTLFAKKPAPLQLTWLGYPHSTGLAAIDYRISDPVADPPGAADRLHTEKLLRLPGFSCFAPPQEAPEVAPSPQLTGGVVTFGSFNNPAKITPETVALWAQVLTGVADSRMLIKGYSLADAGSRDRLLALFAQHGIEERRLELRGNTPSYREHLELYQGVDIALDTFPYNGTTTTCEALWMGVPVVTLAGDSHRSRVGASLLTRAGLHHLVARDPAGYRAAALELAADRQRLARLRGSLRESVAGSPLTDGARFTRELEAALREIWRGWCAGRAPVSAKDQEAAGRRFLREGNLDRALKRFLAALNCDRNHQEALGGIQEALNRQQAADLAEALDRDAGRLAGEPVERGVEGIREATLEECAEVLLALGLVTPAELICRYLQDRGHDSRSLNRTLGEVAMSIGAYPAAVEGFRAGIAKGDQALATRIRLLKAQEAARVLPAADEGERFLLIKAWGYGFWSDVGHLLGQFLLAEITGRIPVVHWGGNSLFSDDPQGNAFEKFFEPVSRFSQEELARRQSFYPPKWNRGNLFQGRLNQGEGAWSRSSSLHALARREEVVVGDYHYAVNDLIPWIPPGHPLHGMNCDELHRYLFQRYLKVKPWIAAKAEAFYRQRMAGRKHLALHVRGGDKGGEDPNLARLNALYRPEIERYLQQSPQARLFLLTDDQEILQSYRDRYRERVVHTGATRTGDGRGVHYQSHPSRYRLGEEVIVDALLALRCDAFIGNGLSNVSCAVAQMKQWAPGTLRLFGARLDRLRQWTLYRS